MRKIVGCGDVVLGLAGLVTAASGASPSPPEFVAVLNGENQVPTRETPATGKALFTLNEIEKAIEYKLTVSKIENVVAAHIHLGKPGEEGPIVAVLTGPSPPGKGPKEGVLAKGAITASGLEGPLRPAARGTQHEEDDDALFAELVSAMQKGEAYVNVHTDLGWAPAAPRPGNFQEGEIRGQIQPAAVPAGR